MNIKQNRRKLLLTLAGTAGAIPLEWLFNFANAAPRYEKVRVLDSTDPIASGIPFRPGHYLVVRQEGRETPHPAALKIAAHPGIRGIKSRFYWRQLERRPGEYDFSGIDRTLEDSVRLNKPALIFLADKSFSQNVLGVPDYIVDNVDLLKHNTTSGLMPPRWNPLVKDRFKKLVASIGDRYDSESLLECVIFQEIILSGFAPGSDYSAQKYYATIQDRLHVARAHFPRTQICQYVNAYLAPSVPGPALIIGNYLREIRGMLGAPDVLPGSKRLAKHLYPYFDQFNGVIPLCAAAQYDSYRHREAKGGRMLTMKEILVFALQRLHLNHMVWTFVGRRWPEFEQNTEEHAMRAIASVDSFPNRKWKFSF